MIDFNWYKKFSNYDIIVLFINETLCFSIQIYQKIEFFLNKKKQILFK